MERLEQVFHTPTRSELESPLYLTWVGYRVCEKTHNIGPRLLPSYKMVLVLSGSGFFELNGMNILIRTGDVFFCFPGVIHHYFANPTDPWQIRWVAFNGRNCAEILHTLAITPDNPVLRNCMTQNLLSDFEQIHTSLARDNVHAYAAVGYAYLAFDEILRIRKNEDIAPKAPTVANDLMHRILTFIDLNYAADLNVDLVSRHVSYSRSHFSHFFKQQTGMSLPEYINTCRIEHAKALLSTTNMSSLEIARSVGYSEADYFSRIFRRLAGETPATYRLLSRQTATSNTQKKDEDI